jgi:hypothetical protein
MGLRPVPGKAPQSFPDRTDPGHNFLPASSAPRRQYAPILGVFSAVCIKKLLNLAVASSVALLRALRLGSS